MAFTIVKLWGAGASPNAETCHEQGFIRIVKVLVQEPTRKQGHLGRWI